MIAHCFVAFANHLICSGWLRHDEVLAMDSAAIHAGGVAADIVEDLLWNAVVEGQALSALTALLPTRSPELNPAELVFHILARWIQSLKCQAAGPSADSALHQANRALRDMHCALTLCCFVHCGC